MKYLHHYSSPLGVITETSDGESLTGLWFEGQRDQAAAGEAVEKPLCIFDETDRWLDLYFCGKVPDFTPALKIEGTPFQQTVWKLLLTISYGQTVTYGEIAKIIAKQTGVTHMSAQAVGGAVGRNPVSLIVPCHRVIGSDGRLTGYAGGIDRKAGLLAIEQRGKAADAKTRGV